MPQAIVDPEELRRFARQLNAFNRDLETNLSALRGQLKNLGATWRDREHDKFAEEFEQTAMAIARFVEASNDHIPFLLRKAQNIDNYLQQR